MPRKIDQKRIEKIIDVLKEHPNGLWVRELARKSEIDKSTVSRYLVTELKNKIEVQKIGTSKLVRLIK